MPIAFYIKARPQGAHAVTFYRDLSRLFIGYPAWRKAVVPGTPIGECVHRLDDSTWSNPESVDWSGVGENRVGYQRMISAQRNLVQRIDVGSFAVIPDLSEGLAYLAKISRPYAVEPSPQWADSYLQLRIAQGLRHSDADHESLLGDVIQGWQTDEWKAVSFSTLPRWLSTQIMGRRTIGELKNGPGDRRALDVIEELYAGIAVAPWEPTDDLLTIESRLLDILTPSSFENLCVSLLQLDEPQHRWQHVGGSGDGGVDGLGFDMHGRCIGALQCKLQSPSGMIDDIRFLESATSVRRVAASLLHPDGAASNLPKHIEFWSSSEIARRILSNAGRLPVAITLRIRLSKQGY